VASDFPPWGELDLLAGFGYRFGLYSGSATSSPIATMAKSSKRKESHFSWPDAIVLAGAALMLPVAIYEGNGFFITLGLAIAAVVGVRVGVTLWLVRRHQTKK